MAINPSECVEIGSGGLRYTERAETVTTPGEIERLRARVAELVAAAEEACSEIEYAHGDMLTPGERAHPRGSGWARVYDRLQRAIRG